MINEYLTAMPYVRQALNKIGFFLSFLLFTVTMSTILSMLYTRGFLPPLIFVDFFSFFFLFSRSIILFLLLQPCWLVVIAQFGLSFIYAAVKITPFETNVSNVGHSFRLACLQPIPYQMMVHFLQNRTKDPITIK